MTSKDLILGLTKNLNKWEDKNWLNVPNAEHWQQLAYLARKRGNKITLKLINNKNEETKEIHKSLKNKLKTKDKPKDWQAETKIPPEFQTDGARLHTLDQYTAYQLIMQTYTKDPSERNSTHQNLEKIKFHYKNTNNQIVEETQIWKSQKKPWISKKIQDYLWKITHNVLKVGNFFKNIPNLEHLQTCACGKTESPEHILIKCKENKAPSLWKEIQNTLNEMDETTHWPIPTIEMIQTPNLISLQCKKGDKLKTEKQKLYQIIMTETTWLLWKERNRRVFDNTKNTKSEIENKWKSMMTKRIEREWQQTKQIEISRQKQKRTQFEQRWCINKKLAEIIDGGLKTNL
ncbi:hypothetical protein EDD17DRAFT_1473266 [Pisolithus thermaeus]|nr:hypothetical protein EV401DRAFT_1853924 [Pisolithus croceorrhizus]KAI6165321.1 hypothetical protein EDD17DRAFT_1473266 [Pisolithus thermaeus]